MSADTHSTTPGGSAGNPKSKSRWALLIPVAAMLAIAWLCNALISIFGEAAILRAGLAVAHSPAWIIGMLVLRLALYILAIEFMRSHLARRQFTQPEIKDATWMMVRVCALYELLFGLKVFSLLGQLIH